MLGTCSISISPRSSSITFDVYSPHCPIRTTLGWYLICVPFLFGTCQWSAVFWIGHIAAWHGHIGYAPQWNLRSNALLLVAYLAGLIILVCPNILLVSLTILVRRSSMTHSLRFHLHAWSKCHVVSGHVYVIQGLIFCPQIQCKFFNYVERAH